MEIIQPQPAGQQITPPQLKSRISKQRKLKLAALTAASQANMTGTELGNAAQAG